MFRRWRAISLLALLIGFILPGYARAQDKSFVVIDPPQPIAPFLFEDEKGRTLDLKDFRGRYVLFNLWSTSCAPCIAEMPKLNEMSRKFDSKKIAVVALTEDHDGKAAAQSFFRRHKIDHLNIYADPTGRAPFVFDIRGLPTTILIDPQGMEVARLEGPADWTGEPMIAFIKTRLSR
jgi:thiol-disulfide isomerase/thioredoxin